MESYRNALEAAEKLNKTTFEFIEGVEVMKATLVGNVAMVEEVGTLMKGDCIMLKK